MTAVTRQSTRTMRSVVLTLALLGLGGALAGCESMENFQFWDTKKKLPGDRKAVFPEGVPGIEQGIPPELVKGYQEPQQPAVDPAAQAAAQEAEKADKKAEAKPKPKPKPKPRTAAAPQQPQAQPAAQQGWQQQPQQPPPQPAQAQPGWGAQQQNGGWPSR